MRARDVHRRLAAANRHLSRKERQIREPLGLRIQPGLALLDESSATYVTAGDRCHLDREEHGAADTSLPQASPVNPR